MHISLRLKKVLKTRKQNPADCRAKKLKATAVLTAGVTRVYDYSKSFKRTLGASLVEVLGLPRRGPQR
jgi:hypothetical protein